jgi:outer membrane autotransporter protein
MANLIDQLSQLSAAGQRAALQMMNGQVNGTLAQLGVQNTTYLYQELRQNMGTGSALSQDPYGSRAGFEFSVPTTAAPDGGIAAVSFTGDGASAGPSPGPSSDPGAAMNAGETGLVGMGSSHEPCWSGWTIGYGSAGTAQSDGNASGGSLDAAGAIVAIERALDNQTLLGLFGAYSHLGVSLSGVPQSANADEGRFGFYVRRDWGDALFDVGRDYSLVAASAGFTNYDETRQVAVGAINSTASGDSTGWAPSVYLEQGHRFDFAHWSLCPYAALQYVYLRQNAYTESGADVLDQSVDGSNTDSLRSFLGTSVASRYVTQSGSVIVPQLRAAWVHEFLDTDTTQTAAFASLGNGTFAAQGLDFGRDWALVGGGVQWQLSPSVSLFGNYDVQVNTRETLNTGSGGIQFAW